MYQKLSSSTVMTKN